MRTHRPTALPGHRPTHTCLSLMVVLVLAFAADCGEQSDDTQTASSVDPKLSVRDTVWGPAQVSERMLRATKQATAQLQALASENVPEDQVFQRVKAITDAHVRAIGFLGERFNGLPDPSRQKFIQSDQGKDHLDQMNRELNLMKALAYDLVKDVPHGTLGFAEMVPAEDVSQLLDAERWPTEPKEHIDAKYWFVRTFLLGVKSPDSQRSQLLVEDLHGRAVEGDRVAIARLNGILKEILAIYPKDDAAAQYNLGVLYGDTGKAEEATKWLEKAVAQGLDQAKVELTRLRSRSVHVPVERLPDLSDAQTENTEPSLRDFLIDQVGNMSPLSKAAAKGDLEEVRRLLVMGNEIDAADDGGWTALHWAAGSGNASVVRLLLENGGDSDPRNADRETPLHLAAKNGRIEVASLLLKYGANPSGEDAGGRTPSSLAAEAGSTDMVKLLEAAGATDVNAQAVIDTTLHKAAQSGTVGEVKALLAQKQDVNARDGQGRRPLHCAAIRGRVDVARLLILAQADLNAADEAGQTPMHLAAAAKEDDRDQLKSEKTEFGMEMSIVPFDGHARVIELLIQEGANSMLLDHEGRTPLDYAIQVEHKAAIELLERARKE